MSLVSTLLRKVPEQREEDKFPKNASPVSPSPWPCPHCGRPADIESVEPSLDGQRMLTFWHCEPCQVWAVTPNTLREPPSAWVSKTQQ